MTAGLYVHVPFCLTRCGYCDFNAYAGLGHLAGRYVRALEREADLSSPAWEGESFGSVYFGGGTPTTLAPADLERLLAHLHRRFQVAAGAETTVEANPDTVDEATLATLRSAGFSRLSMGVQSLDAAVLAALERVHSAGSARRAYRAARRAGYDNVSLDLIYGVHGEGLSAWRRTLEEMISLAPEHVSCYALTVEPATPLGRKVAAGLLPPPDPDLQAEMYDLACGLLGTAGYVHYEVSNWAKPGLESRHNLTYWKRRPYLGLGPGAHSYREGRRWWNMRPPGAYIDSLGAGRLPLAGDEVLRRGEERLERLLLGLRTREGVPSAWVDPGAAASFLSDGLAFTAEGRIALTERGMLLANEVVLALAG